MLSIAHLVSRRVNDDLDTPWAQGHRAGAGAGAGAGTGARAGAVTGAGAGAGAPGSGHSGGMA